MHYPFSPWGKGVGPRDVSEVLPGNPPYSREVVLDSLIDSYDIRYPGIANSDYMKAIPSIEMMQWVRKMASKHM
jgi:hypothetical protein